MTGHPATPDPGTTNPGTTNQGMTDATQHDPTEQTPGTEHWQERFGAAMMRTLATPLAMLVRGEGCYVWDEKGKKYLRSEERRVGKV